MIRSLLASFLSLACIFLLSSCMFRSSQISVTIEVPGMRSTECGDYLKNAIETAYRNQYVLNVAPNSSNGTITITYDANTVASLNLLYSIADAGFDATLGSTKVVGDSVARSKIPQECR